MRGSRGSRGAGPSPGASPCCADPSSHIPPGFPHARHQRVPKAQLFPRPSPARAGEAIFHPLLVFNLLWGKKAAFVGRGAARGVGRGRRRLCVPQLRAWGRRGWGRGARCSGRAGRGWGGRGGSGRVREGAAGPGGAGGEGSGGGRGGAGREDPEGLAGRRWGALAQARRAKVGEGQNGGSQGAGVKAEGVTVNEGVEEKATRACKLIVLLALFAPGPRTGGRGTHTAKGTLGRMLHTPQKLV